MRVGDRNATTAIDRLRVPTPLKSAVPERQQWAMSFVAVGCRSSAIRAVWPIQNQLSAGAAGPR